MSERETSQAIDEAAADWAARLDRGPLSNADEQALELWLQADPRRLGGLARAQALFQQSESAIALGAHFDPAAFSASEASKRPTRRQALGWGGGAIAASLVAVAVGVTSNASRAYASQRGEVRLVPLEDGSTITLNTASKVTVRYTADQRRVRLIYGEAFFEIAGDSQRPFLIEAGDATVRADRAGLVVRKLADAPLQVLVREGRVDVQGSTEGYKTAVPVPANSQVALRAGAKIFEVGPLEAAGLQRELAWREGRIAFEGQTLEDAAKQFARYSDTKIVINDPALARERITGLFAANDPTGFGRTVAGVFGGRVETRDKVVVVSR